MVTSMYRAGPPAPQSEGVAESFYAQRPPSMGLRELLGVLWRRKLVIILIILACLGLAVFAIKSIVPRYNATTTLMFDPRQAEGVSADPVIRLFQSNVPAIESQIQVIASRGVGDRVVADLMLDTVPEFNPALQTPGGLATLLNGISGMAKDVLASLGLGGDEVEEEDLPPEVVAQRQRDRVVEEVLGNLRVEQVGRSQVIAISFTSEDPVQAAEIADAFAEKYITQQLQARFDAMRETQVWLSESLTRMREQTEEAEERLEAYRRQLSDLGDRDPVRIQEELSIVNEQVARTRATLQSSQARYDRVYEVYRTRGAEAVTGMLDSPVIGALRENLATLVQQRAELSSQYDARHPIIQNINAEIASLSGQLTSAVDSAVSSLRVDAETAAQELSLLQDRLQELEDLYAQVNEGAAGLRVLEQEAQATRQMYETFLNRTREAEQLVVDEPDAWIVSSANIPVVPVGPSKMVMMVGAAVLSTFLAFGVALALELLSTTFRTPFEIQQLVGLNVFGTVPRLGQGWAALRSASRTLLPQAYGDVEKAMQTLSINISLAARQRRDGQVVLVTSPRRREGKTTLAVLLARAMTQSDHRTILVDCDFRHSRLGRLLRLPMQQGLASFLTGKATAEAIIQEDPASGTMVITAGQPGAGTGSLLGGPAMAELIRRLRLEYEVIILDSPGLLIAPDGRLLAGLVDAALLTVRWRRTPRQQLARAAAIFGDGQAAAIGAVLTHVPPQITRQD